MAGLRSPVAAAAVMVMLTATACAGDIDGATEVGSRHSTGSTEVNESTPSTTAPDEFDGDLAFGLKKCDPDMPALSADPSFYRDEPIYVGNEQPIEEVRAWASTRPGYQEIWIDRDHNGWISVGFTGGDAEVADRQTELAAEFPDAGVVAVAVPVTDAELWALRSEIEQELKDDPDLFDSWGMGHSVSRGVVELSLPVLSEEYLAPLARFAGRPLCVSGADPADAVADGPQATEGDGWRLLGEDLTGEAYRTGIATTDDQLATLWAEAGLTGEPPPVDWQAEIAVWFGAVYGSSCPMRMDDVVVDHEARLIHGDFVRPGNPTACTSDANPHAFVVALRRDRLPPAPFAVQLDADDPPRGAPEERTTVLVDLRPPGSVATADDLEVLSLEDVDAAGPQIDLFTPGEVIEVGYPWEFRLDLICGVEYIGPLNNIIWRRAPPADGSSPADPPPTWQQAADNGDTWPIAEFLIDSSSAGSASPVLTVTIAGRTEIYEPVSSTRASPVGDQPSC